MKNNVPVSEGWIKNILVDFVKESGSWLKNINTDDFRKKNINHPDSISENSINGWADRLIKAISKI